MCAAVSLLKEVRCVVGDWAHPTHKRRTRWETLAMPVSPRFNNFAVQATAHHGDIGWCGWGCLKARTSRALDSTCGPRSAALRRASAASRAARALRYLRATSSARF